MRLAVGDVVVYAAHGVGRVAAREKRMVLGAAQEILVLELARKRGAGSRPSGKTNAIAVNAANTVGRRRYRPRTAGGQTLGDTAGSGMQGTS